MEYLQKMVTARAGCDPRSTYNFNLQPSCALWSAISLLKKVVLNPKLTWCNCTLFQQQDSSEVEEWQWSWKIKAGVRCTHVDGYIYIPTKPSISGPFPCNEALPNYHCLTTIATFDDESTIGCCGKTIENNYQFSSSQCIFSSQVC